MPAAAPYVDWYNPMTYDFFGAWDAVSPTAPHSPLTSYSGIPKAGFHTSATIAKLKGLGIPASKLLLGIGFYGRGWTGVTQSAPGGTATGPAAGTYEQGIDDYKVLKTKCPATGTVAGDGVRQVREQLVELRHSGDHRSQDDVQEPAGSGRHVLLGAERRHGER